VPNVTGSLIEQRVLVLWRKLSGNLEQDNAVLDAYLREELRLDFSSSADQNQFDVIYVNGSHTLPKLPHCDVRLLEQTFHQRMWESQRCLRSSLSRTKRQPGSAAGLQRQPSTTVRKVRLALAVQRRRQKAAGLRRKRIISGTSWYSMPG